MAQPDTRVRAAAPRRRARPASSSRRGVRLTAAGDTTTEFIVLAGTVGTLIILGLVMTFSASFVESTAQTGNAFGIFSRQLLWSVLGMPLLIAAAVTDYHRWRRLAPPLLAIALVTAIAVLVPGVGVTVNGARRWLDLGPLNFQPSELLKVALPLYLASLLAARWPQLRAGGLRALVLPALPLTLLSAALVMAEPDLETAALIAAVAGIVLFAAGLPARIMWAGAVVTLVGGAAAIATSPFRRGRVLAWLDPMSDSANFGYQTVQGYLALGSGGWTGVGLGAGRGKWLYIPNAHTDYIFAIIGEELGLLGAIFVLLLFVSLAVTGIRTARLAPDPFGRLLAVSLTGWLLLQAAINIGSVVGLLPVTGVTLPLVSFGGSSLVFTMLGVGVIMSVSRQVRAGAQDEDE